MNPSRWNTRVTLIAAGLAAAKRAEGRHFTEMIGLIRDGCPRWGLVRKLILGIIGEVQSQLASAEIIPRFAAPGVVRLCRL